jgi:hypothetical protein
MTHHRLQDYAWKLPSPPRIVVPPPVLAADMPTLRLGNNLARASDGEVDLRFMKEVDLSGVVVESTMIGWSYDRRREAQLVLPWLYLGPLNAAKDQDFLRREGITMTFAIRARDNAMSGALQIGRQVCHEVAAIEVPDVHGLIRNFPRATRMINRHVAKIQQFTAGTPEARMGRVLVFCETGNDRSAAVAAAYLMETLDGLDHIKAMQVCQAQRFCINFDDTLKNVLRSYWEILQAKRSITNPYTPTEPYVLTRTSPQPVSPDGQAQQPTIAGQKRRIEEDEDEDVDMGDAMDHDDVLRFGGRTNTPFRDA